MASARPLNYTTTIPVTQTVGECHAILAAAGASSAATHFENGQQVGLSFSLKTPHGVRAFTLPVDVPAMQAVLRKTDFSSLRASRSKLDQLMSREHAAEVAWHVVKDWLEANLALIAAQMATIDTVMLPFLVVDEERTLYQAYQEHEASLALAAGELE